VQDARKVKTLVDGFFIGYDRCMLGAMLYVHAGKGHYVPAKAVSDAMERAGHETYLLDMFSVLKAPFWQWFCKHEWRFMLQHPRLERMYHRWMDTHFIASLIRFFAVRLHTKRDFLLWYEQTKPDFILCTNFLGGSIIAAIAKQSNLQVPIFIYVADVFNNPKAGFHQKIDRIFIPTSLGVKNLLAQGYSSEQVRLCPFPLQTSIQSMEKLTRTQAREKLGLEDRFTLLLNLGGEGIGSASLLKQLIKNKLAWQVVVVGNLSEATKNRFHTLAKQLPRMRVHTPGFVSNIGLYMLACDIQAGKAGANALMESLSLQRPFMINELLHAARDTKSFFDVYQVGWVIRSPKKQMLTIKTFAESSVAQNQMQEHLASLPLQFDSDLFVNLLINEVKALAD